MSILFFKKVQNNTENHRKSDPVEKSSDLIKGLRFGNTSIKIYRYNSERFLVVKKKYFFNRLFSVKRIIFEDKETAEDFANSIIVSKNKYFSL
jgi:hypothetical protein